MIHMRVREDDFFHAGLHLLDRSQNTLDIAAGIDDRGTGSDFTFDNGAVLLIGGDRDDSTLDRHKQVLLSLNGLQAVP